ncbi:MAG TPA: hypothetical protein VD833_25330 [Vicinamibacterales bacterium]|nr:hypothetical protein [Vicinamibacterales bacterium]
MTGLIAILWVLYLSECVVRWRPGDWVFRPSAAGRLAGVSEPDVTFLDGRFAFVWTTMLPWRAAHVCNGGAFDARSRTRLKGVGAQLGWVRAFATGLFVVVLVVFPALVLTERFPPSIPLLAPGFVVCWAGTLATFFAAHRRVHGCAPKLESWLLLALSPLSLIRAAHAVALTQAAHPLLAAEALCADDEFLRIARLWHFDVPQGRAEIEALVSSRGLRARLIAPPVVAEPGLALYCPRCHATFTQGATQCADCPGVALTPLPRTVLPESAPPRASRLGRVEARN